MRWIVLIAVLVGCSAIAYGQPDTLRVHFLYGSKPDKRYGANEPKWFGGMLGGHVGLEITRGEVVSFVPQGKFHYIAHRRDYHSAFVVHDPKGFWEIFGGEESEQKKATVFIPITAAQKQTLADILAGYLKATPYDYALLGMRCGAATYELLARIGIFKRYAYRSTLIKIRYPKVLRKKLLAKAALNGWPVVRQSGTNRRKWERD